MFVSDIKRDQWTRMLLPEALQNFSKFVGTYDDDYDFDDEP